MSANSTAAWPRSSETNVDVRRLAGRRMRQPPNAFEKLVKKFIVTVASGGMATITTATISTRMKAYSVMV
jgi:hypothetical protein